jgi:hypothetical protein
MQNDRLGLTWALYAQRHSIAGAATDVGFVRSNVSAQRSPIDRRDPVARAQSSLRRWASFYHIIN